MANKPKTPPPVRTLRPMVDQPVYADTIPSLRLQDGEFVFAPIDNAANDTPQPTSAFADDYDEDNRPTAAGVMAGLVLMALLIGLGVSVVMVVRGYFPEILQLLSRVFG
ncbi:hypothetical protein [Variovorax sp. dw_954]|uniref:hypothetical protein n=1 Tax=Variovorax sp. dw_954 TaxID=2720078 RepID=UPI001BD4B924|nr:hypothetical protein [Variovorax sp. dw_954]